MPSAVATYRNVFGLLGATLVGWVLLASFAFTSGAGSQWVDGVLFAPFFAPALASAFVIHAWAKPNGRQLAGTSALGILFTLVHAALAHALSRSVGLAAHLLFGLGLASLVVMAAQSARTKGAAREEWLSVLLPAGIEPAFALAANLFLALTSLLHPMALDASVYAADAFFGHQPSFVVARLFAAAPGLASVSRLVYWNLPLALAFVYGARRRHRPEGSDDVLFSFVAAGVLGFALYHFYPVVGPTFFFGEDFPNGRVPSPDPSRSSFVSLPVPRNCMPSLHTAWALLVFWQARPLARAVRWCAAVWLGLTELATLGFGYHYAMDLVVAVPFTMTVRALFASSWRGSVAARSLVALLGACITLGWLAVLRLAPMFAGDSARWGLAGLTVLVSFLVERGLSMARSETSHDTSPDTAEPFARVLAFAIAAAPAVGSVAITHALVTAFGGATETLSIVVVAVIAGITVGAALANVVGERFGSLRIAAFCIVVASFVWAFGPWLVRACSSSAAAALVVVMPAAALTTVAMIGLLDPSPTARAAFATRPLVASMALGAAAGAGVATYVVLPFLGVTATSFVPVLANLSMGLVMLRRAAVRRPEPARDTLRQAPTRVTRQALFAALAAGSAAAAGAVAIDVHLMRAAVASSAYAAGLFLTAIALDIAIAGVAARALATTACPRLTRLVALDVVFAFGVLVVSRLWNAWPDYFASFDGYSLTGAFEPRELVRMAILMLVLGPPAIFMGALSPIRMDVLAQGTAQRGARARLLAFGAASGLAGVALAFAIVAWRGSSVALQALAVVASMGAVLSAMSSGMRSWPFALAMLGTIACIALPSRELDYELLARFTHDYFRPVPAAPRVDVRESLESDLAVRNGSADEPSAADDAMYALLHATGRRDALLVGIGSGELSRATQSAGFQHVDVVEPSRARLDLARSHGGGAVDAASELHRAPARPFLEHASRSYDLVVVSAVPPWRAGFTSLHSREFYALVKARMSPAGVLETAFSLRYVGVHDIFSIVQTIRSEFVRVWIYRSDAQAVVVACNHDCAPMPAALGVVNTARQLIADRLLTPDAVDKFLAQVAERASPADELVSTDDNLFLELDAPRALVRDPVRSLTSNLSLLRAFAPASPLDGTHLSDRDLAVAPP